MNLSASRETAARQYQSQKRIQNLSQTSKMELFAKIFNSSKLLTFFAENLHLRYSTGLRIHLSIKHLFILKPNPIQPIHLPTKHNGSSPNFSSNIKSIWVKQLTSVLPESSENHRLCDDFGGNRGYWIRLNWPKAISKIWQRALNPIALKLDFS